MQHKCFHYNERVRLKTFHGTETPNGDVQSDENYWLLVGSMGLVVSEEAKLHPAFPDKGPRVLVRLDNDVETLGLCCHNGITNALWIFVSDLEKAD